MKHLLIACCMLFALIGTATAQNEPYAQKAYIDNALGCDIFSSKPDPQTVAGFYDGTE